MVIADLDRDQAEQQLTQALYMVLLSYRNDLKFNDEHILGKCNLILQGFITSEGVFTEEYIELARQALEMRKKMAENDLTPQIITKW